MIYSAAGICSSRGVFYLFSSEEKYTHAKNLEDTSWTVLTIADIIVRYDPMIDIIKNRFFKVELDRFTQLELYALTDQEIKIIGGPGNNSYWRK